MTARLTPQERADKIIEDYNSARRFTPLSIQIAEAIEAAVAAAAPRPLDTRDRLPEVGERVLVFHDPDWEREGRWIPASRHKLADMWVSDNYSHLMSKDVSHWLPLPPPPTAATKGDTKE